jgi:GrpB-like predicted nucleotidyltransferase (UPF0157 family)
VIDIMVGVHSLAEADAYCLESIVGLGYDNVPAFERELPFRCYFYKDNPQGVRTHQIHLVEIETAWWERHLLFRDYLRSRDQARAAYERLKRDLATHEYESTNDYAQAKTTFIRAMEAEALDWRRRQPG